MMVIYIYDYNTKFQLSNWHFDAFWGYTPMKFNLERPCWLSFICCSLERCTKAKGGTPGQETLGNFWEDMGSVQFWRSIINYHR